VHGAILLDHVGTIPLLRVASMIKTVKHDASDWHHILMQCGVGMATSLEWALVFAAVIGEESFSFGAEELDDFLGQLLHESDGLRRMVESLDYSAERLCLVWPKRFPMISDAKPYEHNSEALANKVYGGRMGNTEPGDGWRYRGRSPIQITGKANYEFVGKLMGQDLVTLPGLLEQPHFALEACVHWWEDRIPDSAIGDIEKVTRFVNGGIIGLADRDRLTGLARKALS